jgi:predicted transcriptional regulator
MMVRVEGEDIQVDGRDGHGRRAAGELEGGVLAVLWQAGRPLTATEVNERLPGGLAATTIVTVLARLHAKGMLRRARAGRGYTYEPVRDEASHTAELMVRLLDRGLDRTKVLTQFVAELSDEDEAMLQRLLGGGDV